MNLLIERLMFSDAHCRNLYANQIFITTYLIHSIYNEVKKKTNEHSKATNNNDDTSSNKE